MKEQILKAKLCMPEFTGNFIKRKELTERMHIMQEQAVVLYAGSGYGKTSAMVEYIRRFQEPYIWYQLDRTDDCTEIFLCYLEAALQQHLEGFRFLPHEADWTIEQLEDLANQILGQLEAWGGRLTIILDDFQHIRNEQIYEFLNCFIRFSSHNIRFFLLTKGRFPGFLTKLLFQGRIDVLDQEDFKISKNELIDYLEYHTIYEEENQEEIYACTERILYYSEGWMAAVMDCLQMHLRRTGSLPPSNICGNSERAGRPLSEC